MAEASRLLRDRNLLRRLFKIVFCRRVEPDAPSLRTRAPHVPVCQVAQASVPIEQSIETRPVVVRWRAVREATKVGGAFDVGLRVKPVGSVHVELFDLLLGAAGGSGDAVFGDPDGETEFVAD